MAVLEHKVSRKGRKRYRKAAEFMRGADELAKGWVGDGETCACTAAALMKGGFDDADPDLAALYERVYGSSPSGVPHSAAFCGWNNAPERTKNDVVDAFEALAR